MRVWVCTDHAGHWPVPVGSVVVARSEKRARELLERSLLSHGLDPLDPPFTLREIRTDRAAAHILSDGDY